MPLKIQCPSCRKIATVPDSAAGKTARCGCGHVISIPVILSEPAAAPSDELSLQPSTPEPQVADDIVTGRQKRLTNQAGGQPGTEVTPKRRSIWNALTQQRGPFAGVHSQSTQAGGQTGDAKQQVQAAKQILVNIGCLVLCGVLGVIFVGIFFASDKKQSDGGASRSEKEQYWNDRGEAVATHKLEGGAFGYEHENWSDENIKTQADLNGCPSNYLGFFANG